MTTGASTDHAFPSTTARRRARWEVAILLSWLAGLAVVRAGVLQETDPYWQVRAGMENLDGAPLTRPDSWSWAPVDALFTQTSPLWNDVLGLGYRWAGFAGFFLAGLLSVLAYFAVTVALARRLGARPLPTLAGVLLAVLPALAMLSPRASLVAQTLFMLGLLLADTWRRRSRPPGAVLDVAAVAVAAFLLAGFGSWVHLSWLLLAPATAVAWSVLWWTSGTVGGTRRWLLSAASAIGVGAGVLAGPYGLDAWRLSRQVQDATQGVVLEWAGVFTPGLALRWVPAAVLAMAGFVLAVWWVARSWRRRLDDPRVGLVAALAVVGLPAALAAVDAIRFVGVALLLLAPVAAFGATAAADRVARRAAADAPTGVLVSVRVRRWADAGPWRVVLTLVAVLLLPLVVFAGALLGRPADVSGAVETLPSGCRLFSDPASAGPVLLLRPDVEVWIDGRADYWGHARNAEALRILTGDLLDVPALSDATCVVLQSTTGVDTSALRAALGASKQWARVDTPGGAAVWVRSTP